MPITISAHAAEAMARRGVSYEQLVQCLIRPEIRREGVRNGQLYAVYTRGNLSVVLGVASLNVKTVLLNTLDDWDDPDAEEMLGEYLRTQEFVAPERRRVVRPPAPAKDARPYYEQVKPSMSKAQRRRRKGTST